MSLRIIQSLCIATLVLVQASCSEEPVAVSSDPVVVTSPTVTAPTGTVDFETFELANGLKVVFHVDRSDPVVAVALTAHVGSAREQVGRTGFAHLFEHLLFLESENLGKGGLDAMSARIGGSGANGSTSRDRTNYLQTVPSDALEKMLWAEADKLGWFINTVTEPVLAKEKQVVKNEKRQSYDNQPYGHTFAVITEALYPAGHPYSWEVIGSLDDIQNSTLEDVKTFYQRWYTPNNVTLSVAGDFDTAQARLWVEKYFGEIPRGPELTVQPTQPVTLVQSRNLFHEDNYAQLPELTLVWPGVPAQHPDEPALQVLVGLLANGKNAPLNRVLIDEQKLTGAVDMAADASELAGEIYLSVRAFDGIDLDTVQQALNTGFARFERESFTPRDMERIKTGLEVGYYDSIDTVLGKAANLGIYSAIYNDPALINSEVADLRAVTAEEVLRVYATYVKDRPHVATSFVPKGQSDLALTNAIQAVVYEEPIVAGAEAEFDASLEASYTPTPSSFDRSREPDYGPQPQLSVPAIWQQQLTNGLKVSGITDTELPLVQFELSIEGGLLLEVPQQAGAGALLAAVFDKGTATRTPAELEEALALLGATLDISSGTERFFIRGRTLARNFDATLALVTELLLQPRWDAEELELARTRTTADLQDALASPVSVADRAWAQVFYGSAHPFARDTRGTPETVAALTLADLQAYHGKLAPMLGSFRVVGAVDQAAVTTALTTLAAGWTTAAPELSAIPVVTAPVNSAVYFYDIPGAAQSVLRFGRPGPLRTDADYDAMQVLNYRLGGGGFASRLVQEVRESKGYTYGINSRFSGTARQGSFFIGSSVRSNVTLEAAELIRSIVADYGATFTEEDLAVSKSYLLKSQARAFEALDAKLGMLGQIADYGLPVDYVLQQSATVEAMTVDRIRALAATYLQPQAMHYIVVGDAATQAAGLEALGYGAPILLNNSSQ